MKNGHSAYIVCSDQLPKILGGSPRDIESERTPYYLPHLAAVAWEAVFTFNCSLSGSTILFFLITFYPPSSAHVLTY